MFYLLLAKSSNGNGVLGSLKALPEMTTPNVQIVYLGTGFQGAGRQDVGDEAEKKAKPVQRCIIRLPSPLDSQCSILLELLMSLMKYASELSTRGAKQGRIFH